MIKKKIIKVAAVLMALSCTAHAAQFTDTQNHWARETIDTLADMGVVSGVTDTLFMPDGTVTRAEYLKMIMEALNLGTADLRPGECLDAAAYDWYAPYLQRALDIGIIPGDMVLNYKENVEYTVDENGNTIYSKVTYSGAFNGNIPITRQEMAVLTQYAYQYTRTVVTNKTAKDEKGTMFEDRDDISGWATVSVEQAVANGFMEGMDDNYFKPADTATRAQAATVILRVITKN